MLNEDRDVGWPPPAVAFCILNKGRGRPSYLLPRSAAVIATRPSVCLPPLVERVAVLLRLQQQLTQRLWVGVANRGLEGL